MTPAEYIQMKAFARLDGVLLAVLWVSSFALYVAGLALPVFGLAAMVLMVATPFFVGFRLGKFRDEGVMVLSPFGVAGFMLCLSSSMPPYSWLWRSMPISPIWILAI